MSYFNRLIGQFVVSAGESQAPPEWRFDRIGDWYLGRHPALPVMRLLGGEDRPLGWMLGYPISEAGTLLTDGAKVRVPAQALESEAATEAFIYTFAGRFAVLVLDDHPRFYVDPCGSLAAVYCAHRCMVASTPNLIPYDEHSRDRIELTLAIGIPYTDGMYPLDMTPRYGVTRVLPNHYVDLRGWRTVRHWPKQPLEPGASVEETVAEIATLIRRNIGAIVRATPTYLKLTAGWDSRMLLACAREWAPSLELFTAEIGDLGAATDCDTARRIAKRFGLRHRILPWEEPRDEDLEEWMFRIGYSTSERRGWRTATMYKRLPGGHAVLAGNAGEIARAYYWNDSDTEATVIVPERLVAHCECPLEEETVERARAWLESLPTTNAFNVLDLFMIEQDVGGWASVVQHAESDPGFAIFPLCHRRILERMLALPGSYRRSGNLPRDIIAREWPGLLEWPINQPIGATRLLFRMKRAIRRAALM